MRPVRRRVLIQFGWWWSANIGWTISAPCCSFISRVYWSSAKLSAFLLTSFFLYTANILNKCKCEGPVIIILVSQQIPADSPPFLLFSTFYYLLFFIYILPWVFYLLLLLTLGYAPFTYCKRAFGSGSQCRPN
jgi:hypothetical protein